jgi:polysaccharide export outer membrane protein
MTVRSFQALPALALGGLMLAGCAQDTGLRAGLVSQTDLPPPSSADLVSATTPYRVGPLDRLTITVFSAPDLSGSFQTDAAGKLSLPLIGEMQAAGETPTDLAAKIAQRLRGNYVRDPQVTVNLEESSRQTFTVDGQVTQPGSYPIAGNMSLMRAIATAKGASEYARLEEVVVFRTVDGKSMAALYDLEAIRRGQYADPRIYPNDVIIVGDSKERRRIQQLMQASPFLTPVILVLERLG